jgi:alpha-beta hydrolase superfamily lysophospholipase
MAGVNAKLYGEQVLLFGEQRSLVGILTRPTMGSVAESTALPAVVILNTGVIHRVGHHRMYVTLARTLAATGRTVLRFDFSGLGDSAPRAGQLPPLQSCMADLADVLNELDQQHGIKRVVLVGLCSGADHAVLYAHTDSRVAGLILMDPTLPPTRRYYFHYILQRLGNFKNWVSFITLRSGLLRLVFTQMQSLVTARPDVREATLSGIQFSPYLALSYEKSMAHGVRALAVFTSLSPRHIYRQQMLDAFPRADFDGKLTVEYLDQSDHLFTLERDRTQLSAKILGWLNTLPA